MYTHRIKIKNKEDAIAKCLELSKPNDLLIFNYSYSNCYTHGINRVIQSYRFTADDCVGILDEIYKFVYPRITLKSIGSDDNDFEYAYSLDSTFYLFMPYIEIFNTYTHSSNNSSNTPDTINDWVTKYYDADIVLKLLNIYVKSDKIIKEKYPNLRRQYPVILDVVIPFKTGNVTNPLKYNTECYDDDKLTDILEVINKIYTNLPSKESESFRNTLETFIENNINTFLINIFNTPLMNDDRLKDVYMFHPVLQMQFPFSEAFLKKHKEYFDLTVLMGNTYEIISNNVIEKEKFSYINLIINNLLSDKIKQLRKTITNDQTDIESLTSDEKAELTLSAMFLKNIL